MWNIQSTTRLLKQMSQSTDPGELIRLFFDHIRQTVDVQRALVISGAGLSAPQYRLIHNISRNDPGGSVHMLEQPRRGGLLAEFLYLGEVQNITNYAPDPSDLLQCSSSLMAFPHRRSALAPAVVTGVR